MGFYLRSVIKQLRPRVSRNNELSDRSQKLAGIKIKYTTRSHREGRDAIETPTWQRRY